jgi:hypothetical protein
MDSETREIRDLKYRIEKLERDLRDRTDELKRAVNDQEFSRFFDRLFIFSFLFLDLMGSLIAFKSNLPSK